MSVALSATDPRGDLCGRGTAGAGDAQGTPTQSHISPSTLVYEEKVTWATVVVAFLAATLLQGYLAYKKPTPPRTL